MDESNGGVMQTLKVEDIPAKHSLVNKSIKV